MANCIARAQGFTSKGPKAGEATRLGSEYVRAEANTWRTFVTVVTSKDGSVGIQIKRDDKSIAYISVNAETEASPIVLAEGGPELRFRVTSG